MKVFLFSMVGVLSSTFSIAQYTVKDYDRIAQSIINYTVDIDELKANANFLTNKVGSKLTGSQALDQASMFITSKAAELGMDSAYSTIAFYLDYGWENSTTQLAIVEPYFYSLNTSPIAWTSSTDGILENDIVFIEAENVDFLGNPMVSNEKLEANRKLLENKLLILHNSIEYKTDSTILLNRLSEEYFEIDRPNKPNLTIERLNGMITSMAKKESDFNKKLREIGVKGIIQPSQRNHGIIRGHGSFSGMFAEFERPIPHLLVSSSDYNRVLKLVQTGTTKIRAEVVNKFTKSAPIRNTFVEVKGAKNPDEIVLLGAHLDTWHLSDGATDNVAGVLILLEAMKILKGLDLKMDRTIKLAFWSGEEQGLLGSTQWVSNESEKLDNISAYLNVDSGTGKIRGITSQLNESAIPIFEKIFDPLRSIGVLGVKHQHSIGSDYMAFNEASIPAFDFKQDPIDYFQRTHHTNLDSYEYLRFDEIAQAAQVVAATVYYLANMKEKFSRK